MKYIGIPSGMWLLFRSSFQKNLSVVLGYDKATAKDTAVKARDMIMGLFKKIVSQTRKPEGFQRRQASCALTRSCSARISKSPSFRSDSRTGPTASPNS